MNKAFVVKLIVSATLIAFASWLAGRKPILAGFIIALPLTSMLAIVFSYLEYKSIEKTNEFAVSILAAVPLSLFFFIPFLLNKWIKLSFPASYILGVVFLGFAYLIHTAIFKA